MYVRLSSDSASRQTPLPLAKFFPLLGDFGTSTLENVRSPGAQEKMEETKHLLRYSDKPVTAIGSYLGFSSASHFFKSLQILRRQYSQ